MWISRKTTKKNMCVAEYILAKEIGLQEKLNNAKPYKMVLYHFPLSLLGKECRPVLVDGSILHKRDISYLKKSFSFQYKSYHFEFAWDNSHEAGRIRWISYDYSHWLFFEDPRNSFHDRDDGWNKLYVTTKNPKIICIIILYCGVFCDYLYLVQAGILWKFFLGFTRGSALNAVDIVSTYAINI